MKIGEAGWRQLTRVRVLCVFLWVGVFCVLYVFAGCSSI